MAFVCSGEPAKPHEGIINTIEKLVVGRSYCANQPAKMVDVFCSHIYNLIYIFIITYIYTYI